MYCIRDARASARGSQCKQKKKQQQQRRKHKIMRINIERAYGRKRNRVHGI